VLGLIIAILYKLTEWGIIKKPRNNAAHAHDVIDKNLEKIDWNNVATENDAQKID